MHDTYSRRVVLALGGIAVSSVAGCLQTDDQSISGAERQTTVSCKYQTSTPDISIWNSFSTPHTVTVTLVQRENETETPFFERMYEVPASEYVDEPDKIFAEWEGGECIANVTTEEGWSATAEVTTVAQSPWNYGVQVELNENVGNLAVGEHHVDPGENTNPNCY